MIESKSLTSEELADTIPPWLKRLWVIWVGLVLGPFALWFSLLGKWRRRGLEKQYPVALAFMWFAAMAFYFLLFLLPLSHLYLLAIYGMSVGLSSFLIFKLQGLDFFHFSSVTKRSQKNAEKNSWIQCQLAAFIAIVPLAYLGGLVNSLIELRAFSIQWPGSVYIQALFTSLATLPLVFGLGWLLWKSPIPAQVRTILVFFASLVCIGAWVFIWETVDTRLLNWLWGGIREPLLFNPWTEQKFRFAVKAFFWFSGALLGIDYLMLATQSVTLFRRAFYLGLPAGIAYVQMLFVLGDWNYYLGALQATCLREQKLSAYSLLAASKTARVPEAFRTPYDLEELAEYRYEMGETQSAKELWNRMRSRLQSRPYARDLQRRAEHYVSHLENVKLGTSGHGEMDSVSIELPLQLIRPTPYLDADWYALLSAVAYLHPEWTELEIKKRLLGVSPSLQIDLPAITGIPVLRSLLDKIGIAHRCGYADGNRLRDALNQGLVPFVNVSGIWSAIAGFDAARDAYLLYQYPVHYEHNPWWDAPELEVVTAQIGPVRSGQKLSNPTHQAAHVPIRRAIPAPELERTLHDIGGVCVYLGDSSWISTQEDRGAFLVELGDSYYQEQDNDAAAADAYAQSMHQFPNDYVASRILYLKRRWQFRHQDPGDYSVLFRKPGLPEWAQKIALDSTESQRIRSKIWNGTMGQYLLLSWVAPIPPVGTHLHESRLDSAERAFTILRKMVPSQALYLDSLASFAHRRGKVQEESEFLDTLSRYHPFGDEDIQFRLAWARFLSEDTVGALKSLKHSQSFAHHARYQLMMGAIECGQGNSSRGRSWLEKSLKQDKSDPRIHREWRHCQDPNPSHPESNEYLKRWEERTQ